MEVPERAWPSTFLSNAEKEKDYIHPKGYIKFTTRASRIAKTSSGSYWTISLKSTQLKDFIYNDTDLLALGSTAYYADNYDYTELGYFSDMVECRHYYTQSTYKLHRTFRFYDYQTIYHDGSYGVYIKDRIITNGAPRSSDFCGVSYTNAQHRWVNTGTNSVFYIQYTVYTKGPFNVAGSYGHRTIFGSPNVSISLSGQDIGFSFNTGTDKYESQPILIIPSDYK